MHFLLEFGYISEAEHCNMYMYMYIYVSQSVCHGYLDGTSFHLSVHVCVKAFFHGTQSVCHGYLDSTSFHLSVMYVSRLSSMVLSVSILKLQLYSLTNVINMNNSMAVRTVDIFSVQFREAVVNHTDDWYS